MQGNRIITQQVTSGIALYIVNNDILFVQAAARIMGMLEIRTTTGAGFAFS